MAKAAPFFLDRGGVHPVLRVLERLFGNERKEGLIEDKRKS